MTERAPEEIAHSLLAAVLRSGEADEARKHIATAIRTERRAAIEDCARVVDGLVRELEADEWADVLGVKVAAQRIRALVEEPTHD